jgi:Arc/MetJ family transcription regulator
VSRKTTISIDDDLVAQAQTLLGTRGLKDTIDAALTEIVRAARRRELAEQLASGEGLDFDKATRLAARRWRA